MLTKQAIFLYSFLFLIVYGCRNNTEEKLTAFQQETIDYFHEIALQAEYDDSPNRVIKWKENMKIYILDRENHPQQVVYIQEAIDQLNPLLLDGFQVEIAEYLEESNTVLYLTSRNEIDLLNPSLLEGFGKNVLGLAYLEWMDFTIFKAEIFINTEEPLDIQQATILEEITQSIGLLNDSEWNTKSVFYQYKSDTDKQQLSYSESDSLVIQLLYHPKMRAGFSKKKSGKVSADLLTKKANLSDWPF